MKRSSTVIFEPSTKAIEFRYKQHVPKRLVDYSVHDDSDDDCELRKSDAVAELQNQLKALIHPINSKLQASKQGADEKALQCKMLMDQASLQLKAEEEDEKDRNDRLLKQVSDALDSAQRQGHLYRKKRKVEMSVVIEKLVSRKCRLLKGKVSSASSTHPESALRKRVLQVFLKKHNRH